jgi:hypothetical protein
LKALFANEEKRLKEGLGARLERLRDPADLHQPEEGRDGAAHRARRDGDDPRLIDLRDRVKSLGGSFKDATIRGYVPATK